MHCIGGNAFWKSWQQLILLSQEERKLHNKSSADKELVAFIFWEVLLLSPLKKSD